MVITGNLDDGIRAFEPTELLMPICQNSLNEQVKNFSHIQKCTLDEAFCLHNLTPTQAFYSILNILKIKCPFLDVLKKFEV